MMRQTLWFETALLPGGWEQGVRLTIADGLIASIDIGAAADPGADRHGAAIPGLPNLHSHAFQRAMAGLTEKRGQAADSFWTWRELMYRFAQRLDPDTMQAVAALAFVEMLETGFTRSGEFHYIHHQPTGQMFDDPGEMSASLAAAAEETGIGLTLLPVFYAAAGFGGTSPSVLQQRFVSTLDGFEALVSGAERAVGALPDGVVGVAPHSLRAVPPDLLAQVARLRPKAPVHLHIAEQVREVEDCLAWSGRRPVEWLLDEIPVDARWCLVHATHVTPPEWQAIVASRAVVGLCPITEANLGDGLFPAADFHAAGGRFGVGTDSNIEIDASGELRLLEYGQRLIRRERNVLARRGGATGRALFDAALAGGANALGQSVTGLAVGAPADIVTLDRGHTSLGARHGDALLDGWIFSGGRSAVDCVWRRGALLVKQGRHRDRSRVVERYRGALKQLLNGD